MKKSEDKIPLLKSNWIWNPEWKGESDQYLCFRRLFQPASNETEGFIDIAADSDFKIFVNRRECGGGQFSDLRHRKTWSRFSLPLKAGQNVISIIVFYRGEDFFDYQAGRPGLIALLQTDSTTLATDNSWRVRPHPAFRSGFRERMTPQCGFTYEFDAQKEDSWLSDNYDDTSWNKAEIVQREGVGNYWHSLLPRPLPSLIQGSLPHVRICMQGSFIETNQSASIAERMSGAALRAEFPWKVFGNSRLRPDFAEANLLDQPPKDSSQYLGPPLEPGTFISPGTTEPLLLLPVAGTNGCYLVIDLGVETVGWVEFEINAPAGAVLEVGHGEHLADGRVRTRVGLRNFADRYICREGRQQFQMPFRRLGARYLQVHVSRFDQLQIYYFALRPIHYPTTCKGEFEINDPLARRTHEVAIRTLELCRHEHYEDSPWREQALYAYDSRLQALYGYYAFGDYQFPEVSFSLLGQTLGEDNLIALTAPGAVALNIPIFSFAWIVAIAEHWLYSGENILFSKFENSIRKMLAFAFTRRDIKTGLYYPPHGPEFWRFYSWTPGLNQAMGSEDREAQYDAAYNLHLHEAARCFARMLRWSRKEAEAIEIESLLSQLRENIDRIFWDPNLTIYRSTLTPTMTLEGEHELIQALMICEGVGTPDQREKISQTLISGTLAPTMLAASFYSIVSSVEGSAESRSKIFSQMEDTWANMLLSGATTFWETTAGGRDFDYAGSLCHGWSALPIYYHQALVLGVTPLSPGFKQFCLQIYPGRHSEVRGSVPTPYGQIYVRWKKIDTGLRIEVTGPTQCMPQLRSFPEIKIISASYNDTSLIDKAAHHVLF